MNDMYIDDSDLYGHLSQTVVLNILNDECYPATTKTLAKYCKLGLMMLPKSKMTRMNNSDSRTYYCPLSIIEFMTAYLLMSGNYLDLKSSKRIARYTPQEILVGRLSFFSGHPKLLEGKSFALEDGAFNYKTFKFCCSEDGYSKPNRITKALMKDISNIAMPYTTNNLAGFYGREELGDAAAHYMGLLYETTFQVLYDKHIEKILYFKQS